MAILMPHWHMFCDCSVPTLRARARLTRRMDNSEQVLVEVEAGGNVRQQWGTASSGCAPAFAAASTLSHTHSLTLSLTLTLALSLSLLLSLFHARTHARTHAQGHRHTPQERQSRLR
eukprot:599025-Rhodomonas_salina.1